LTYDLGGRLGTVTNELNETTTYDYDPQNNVLSVMDNLDNTTTYAYDAKGSLKTVTDANRKPLDTPETGAACGAAGTGNDVDEDVDGRTDDGCPSMIYNYDAADRMIEVIDALGQRTTYGYDPNGNRTSVTNANRQPVGSAESGGQCGSAGTGNDADDDADTVKDDGCPSIIYAYDALNRLQSATDSLGRATSYEYDAASNLSELTDARSLVTRYVYDALNRVTGLDHYQSDGQTLVDSVDYTYDAVGNRLTMVDPTGTTNYVYDALNRPTSITFPGSRTVSYDYQDNVGNRTRITYPDGKYVDYAYDEAHRMETVTDWLTHQTTYTYDDAGRLTKAEYPNSVWTDYGYDDADRLTGVANEKPGSTISSFTYILDAVGNRRPDDRPLRYSPLRYDASTA
jgi:YD repeat-containing protein